MAEENDDEMKKFCRQQSIREIAETDQAREEAKRHLGKRCDFLDDETICASADYYLGRLDDNQRRMYEQDKDRVESHLKQCPVCSLGVLEAVRGAAEDIAVNLIGNDMYRIASELEALTMEQLQNDKT